MPGLEDAPHDTRTGSRLWLPSMSSPREPQRTDCPRSKRSALGLALAVLATATPVVASGCAAQNLSRTLGRGNVEGRASVGGPIFKTLGPAIPIPNAHLGARVGVTEWMDVDANVNLLAAAYGILALDVAGNFQLFRRPHGLAIAGSARLYTLGDLDDAPGFRAYPELGLHVGGPVPGLTWLSAYGGLLGTFQLTPPDDKPWGFVTPFAGLEFSFPRIIPRPRPPRSCAKARRYGLAVQLSYVNPGVPSPSLLDTVPGYGIFALHLAYRVQFGGLDR